MLWAMADASRVLMQPAVAEFDRRTVRYAVSDNEGATHDGGPPVWAVNIHGFFAGGGMYWRESARLAAGMGWRVVNPSLPAFGGSTPLPWAELSMASFAGIVARTLDHLEVERAVVLGHSMGGAVAMQFAHDFPDRTLGVVYRDGAGPSSWKDRGGVVSWLLSPVAPDVGAAVEFAVAALADVPDLAWGRVGSMLRGVAPDARRNVYGLAGTFPVAAMLFSDGVDGVIRDVALSGVPVLPMWGRFDRLVPPATGHEFGELVGEPVVWVRGGHSWMLPRPGTQLRVLQHHAQGQGFVARAVARHQAAAPAPANVRPIRVRRGAKT